MLKNKQGLWGLVNESPRLYVIDLIKAHNHAKEETLLEFLTDYLNTPWLDVYRSLVEGRLRVEDCRWVSQYYKSTELFTVKGKVVFSVCNGVAYKHWKEEGFEL